MCVIVVCMDTKIFFTDGSVLPQHGCDGYAAVPMHTDGSADIDHVISGCKFTIDVQEMELMAVVTAIKSVPVRQPVTIFTDHQSICDVIAKKERANCERGRNRKIWNQLRQLCNARHVTLRWVKGHAGIPGNVAADLAAKTAARSLIPVPTV